MKNKNLIFGLVIIAVFVAGLILMSGSQKNHSPESQSTGTASVLAASENFFDFGEIKMSAGTVRHDFTVKNPSSAPVKVTTIYTSCMCTKASLILDNDNLGPFGMPGHGFSPSINKVIEPGEEAVVEAIFDPNAHGPAGVGRNDRMVYVETDQGGTLKLSFTALVTP